MLIVTVEFEVDPKHVHEFRSAMMRQASDSLESESACRQFDVCFAADQETRCFLYEQYDDRAAFDAHLQTNHFRQFDQTVAPWVVRKTVKQWVLQDPTAG